MKIYFAGSIRGGREDAELYSKIIKYLQLNHEVLTEHVGKKELALKGEDGLSDLQIHRRDLNWIVESKAMIAEVSTPSLGVGYEIGRAVGMEKPILCLYRQKGDRRLSAMISGCPYFINRSYQTFDEVKNHIDGFLKRLR